MLTKVKYQLHNQTLGISTYPGMGHLKSELASKVPTPHFPVFDKITGPLPFMDEAIEEALRLEWGPN